MEYTKGKWYLDTNDADDATRYYDVFAWIEGSNQYPCHIAEINHCTLEVIANAHLIAAAPDLYEACKLLRNIIDKLIQEGTIPITRPDIVSITMASNEALWAISKVEGK